GPELVRAPADLDDEAALDGVEPLLLLQVEMARRPAPPVAGLLDDEERATSLRRGHLEREVGDAHAAGLTVVVGAGGHRPAGVRLGVLAHGALDDERCLAALRHGC